MSNQAIRATLRGIQKVSSIPVVRRQPVSGALLRGLSSALDGSPFGRPTSLIIKAAIYLGFYGFLRPGEFTCSAITRSTLLKRHFVRHGGQFLLLLPSSKTNQVGPPVKIEFFPTSNSWCPVRVLGELAEFLQPFSPDDPLLPLQGSPLTSAQFFSYIRPLVEG